MKTVDERGEKDEPCDQDEARYLGVSPSQDVELQLYWWSSEILRIISQVILAGAIKF